MTLADLNFTFNDCGIGSLEDTVKSKITEDTFIKDTPEKIYEIFQLLVNKLKEIDEANFENLANDFEKYWNDQAEKLKADVEANLALSPDKLYDIHVQNAEKAKDSDKLEGKSLVDVAGYIYTNYVANATVANSLHLENKSLDDIKDDIKKNLKVNNASHADNSDKLEGLTLDQVIAKVQTDSSTDWDGIKNKVENDYTAHAAKVALAFGPTDTSTNYTPDYWKNTIIPGIKVKHSKVADYLIKDVTKDPTNDNIIAYNDLTSDIQSKVNNVLDTLTDSDDFKDDIKKIKVNNASKADDADNASLAANSTKFNGYTQSDYDKHIKEDIKVDKAAYADNSGKFNNYTQNEYDTHIKTDIKVDNAVKADSATTADSATKADNSTKFNGYTQSDYDKHIKEDIKVDKAAYADDSTKFGGYTVNDYDKHIQDDLKINYATTADNAKNATRFGNYTVGSLETYYVTDMIRDTEGDNVITPLFFKTVDELLGKTHNATKYKTANISPLMSTMLLNTYNKDKSKFNSKLTALFDPDSVYGLTKTQLFDYDDNGNITQIRYLNYSADDSKPDDLKDKLDIFAKKEFSYDDKGNISKIKTTIYPYDDLAQGYSTYVYTVEYTYDDKGNIIKIKQTDFSGICAADNN